MFDRAVFNVERRVVDKSLQPVPAPEFRTRVRTREEAKMKEEQTIREQWLRICTYLKAKSASVYEQWFTKMTPLGVENGVMMLGVPDTFFGDWVRDNYGDLLNEAILTVLGEAVPFDFEAGHLPAAREELPEEVREALTFHMVKRMEEAESIAFAKELK